MMKKLRIECIALLLLSLCACGSSQDAEELQQIEKL